MLLVGALFFSGSGWAQTWQRLPDISIDIPTTITSTFDDPDLAFLTTEHNGAWRRKLVGSVETFQWEFIYPYGPDCSDPATCGNPGLGVVHIGRLLSAPSTSGTSRILYSLNHHVAVSRFDPPPINKWVPAENVLPHSGNDPWVALAIAPDNSAHLLAGGDNLIRRSTTSGIPPIQKPPLRQRPGAPRTR